MSKSQDAGQPTQGEPVNRYFFAVVPRAETIDIIDWIADNLRKSGRLTGRAIGPRYHISLCGVAAPGEAPEVMVTLLKQIGNQVRGGPFAVRFDHALSFGRPTEPKSTEPKSTEARSTGPRSTGLDKPRIGQPKSSRAKKVKLRPLVLANSDRLPALENLWTMLREAMAAAGLPAKGRFFPHVTLLYDGRCIPATEIDPVGWTVHDFVLIRSVHGESRHEYLARWPLGGGRSGAAA
jgi:2'-5' RNA ligase